MSKKSKTPTTIKPLETKSKNYNQYIEQNIYVNTKNEEGPFIAIKGDGEFYTEKYNEEGAAIRALDVLKSGKTLSRGVVKSIENLLKKFPDNSLASELKKELDELKPELIVENDNYTPTVKIKQNTKDLSVDAYIAGEENLGGPTIETFTAVEESEDDKRLLALNELITTAKNNEDTKEYTFERYSEVIKFIFDQYGIDEKLKVEVIKSIKTDEKMIKFIDQILSKENEAGTTLEIMNNYVVEAIEGLTEVIPPPPSVSPETLTAEEELMIPPPPPLTTEETSVETEAIVPPEDPVPEEVVVETTEETKKEPIPLLTPLERKTNEELYYPFQIKTVFGTNAKFDPDLTNSVMSSELKESEIKIMIGDILEADGKRMNINKSVGKNDLKELNEILQLQYSCIFRNLQVGRRFKTVVVKESDINALKQSAASLDPTPATFNPVQQTIELNIPASQEIYDRQFSTEKTGVEFIKGSMVINKKRKS